MGAYWEKAVAMCPQGYETAPSPADIEKLICQVASEKQVEDKAVDEVCEAIAAKFPSVKFNPDCKTVVSAYWEKAVAMCPQGYETAPSPADIEKLICQVASEKQVRTRLWTRCARRSPRS